MKLKIRTFKLKKMWLKKDTLKKYNTYIKSLNYRVICFSLSLMTVLIMYVFFQWLFTFTLSCSFPYTQSTRGQCPNWYQMSQVISWFYPSSSSLCVTVAKHPWCFPNLTTLCVHLTKTSANFDKPNLVLLLIMCLNTTNDLCLNLASPSARSCPNHHLMW